jgi:holo-[acyl-carrier protein] synthase
VNGALFGVGIDLVDLEAFDAMLARRGDSLLRRAFTKEELAYARARRHPELHLAARWAAKEAAFKALGTGWSRGIDWRDVSVVSRASGAPTLAMRGRFAELMRRRGVRRGLVSLTHDAPFAAAVVVLLR